MNRRTLRGLLVACLLVSAGFAAWSWYRPYAWKMDPAARCRVVGSLVKQDRSNFWVNVHLKMIRGQTHDLMKPVRLITAAGRELEPAETTLGGDADEGTRDLWFKFWLESGDIEGPLTLSINDGTLTIKAGTGMPNLGSSNEEYFITNHW